jgi:hypothetical protein
LNKRNSITKNPQNIKPLAKTGTQCTMVRLCTSLGVIRIALHCQLLQCNVVDLVHTGWAASSMRRTQSSSWCVPDVELRLTEEWDNSEKSLRLAGSGMSVDSMSAKFSKSPSGVSCVVSWKNLSSNIRIKIQNLSSTKCYHLAEYPMK